MRANIGSALLAASAAIVMLVSLDGSPAALAQSAASKPAGAELGSVDFTPSVDLPIGWRGDGTGRYPGATGPTDWGRWPVHLVADLTCQGKKPSGDTAGDAAPMTLGLIDKWLILGPFPTADAAKALDEEVLTGEAAVQPDEGDKAFAKADDTTKLAWKPWTVCMVNEAREDTGRLGVDFTAAFGKLKSQVAYAHSYIFSREAGKALMILEHQDGARIWLNGKVVSSGAKGDRREQPVELVKGWNRLLVKSVWTDHVPDCKWNSWKVSVTLAPDGPVLYRTKDVLWMTPMPSGSNSMPLIVGDKVFVTAEPYYLLCLDKNTGKVLWMKSHTYYDGLTDSRKKDNPDADKLAALSAKQAELVTEMVTRINAVKPEEERSPAALLDAQWKATRADCEEKLILGSLDKKIWQLAPEQGSPGWSVATPCSDGKFVYVHFMNNVVACYDMDGTRQWIAGGDFPDKGPSGYYNGHHGFTNSPVLVGGKFITCQTQVKAFDAKTGEVHWHQEPIRLCWGALSAVKIGNVDYAFTAEGTFMRASDGKLLWDRYLFGNANVAAPIIEGDTIFACFQQGGLTAAKLPADESGKLVKLRSFKSPTKPLAGGRSSESASPVLYDGIMYALGGNGTLTAADARSGEMIYQQVLDMQPVTGYIEKPGLCASPAIAGNRLYAVDNANISIVVQTGRQFKQVARNVIWGEGQTLSTPVFEGRRMYFRAPGHLYCIGEK